MVKLIEKAYVFLWKYMESPSIYRIDNAIIFFHFGTLCWFISLTVDQKFHWLGSYSLYIGYSFGIITFIIMVYSYLRWTKKVVKKHNLSSNEKYPIKYKYLKLVIFGFIFWITWFMILAFFAFVVDIELTLLTDFIPDG